MSVCLHTGYGKSLYHTVPFVMEHELGEDRAVTIMSALVAILSPSTSVSKTTLVQRSAFAETSSSVHQKLLQLLNGEMS